MGVLFQPFEETPLLPEPNTQMALLIEPNNHQTPKPKLQGPQRSHHLSGLLVTIPVIIVILIGIVFRSIIFENKNGQESFIGCFVLFYLIYWVECCCSRSQSFLLHNTDAVDHDEFLKKIKSAPPRLGTRIECYHYEDHVKVIDSYRGWDGVERKETETHRVKVTTFTETSYFEYKSWRDATIEEESGNGASLIKLDVERMFAFDSPETEQKFKEYRKNYIESNKTRDQEFISWPVFEIPGYRTKVLTKKKGAHQSSCVDICWFWIWSLFLLSWPYRLWFGGLSQDQKVTLRKVISA